MTVNIPVHFKFKTSSAKSLEEMVKKDGAASLQEMTKHAIYAYIEIARDFNSGCNIVEIDTVTGAERCIDLFTESASAALVNNTRMMISENLAKNITRLVGNPHLSVIFSDAYYFYDRALDTHARGGQIVARSSDYPINAPSN